MPHADIGPQNAVHMARSGVIMLSVKSTHAEDLLSMGQEFSAILSHFEKLGSANYRGLDHDQADPGKQCLILYRRYSNFSVLHGSAILRI
jgi:hypothetical protein